LLVIFTLKERNHWINC